MDILHKIINALLGTSSLKIVPIGPGTLDELLKQFDEPPKQKSSEEIVRDYQIKETMAKMELDLLVMDPSLEYRGCQSWYDQDKNKYFDFVPCVVRPEVIYCSYGKN